MNPDQLIATEKIPHALLFTGDRAGESARSFAHKVILKDGEKHRKKLEAQNHPDLHLYYPEGKTALHSIKVIRDLAKEASFAPFEAKWKIFVIFDAERMLPTSGNALLKTLEEPPVQTLIFLVSHRPDKLLPTIRSRCQIIDSETAEEDTAITDILLFLVGKLPKEQFVERYQEKIVSDPLFQSQFFSLVMRLFRDRWLWEQEKEAHSFLDFPQAKGTQDLQLVDLDHLQRVLQKMRTALERSMKFSVCLDFLEFSCHSNGS